MWRCTNLIALLCKAMILSSRCELSPTEQGFLIQPLTALLIETHPSSLPHSQRQVRIPSSTEANGLRVRNHSATLSWSSHTQLPHSICFKGFPEGLSVKTHLPMQETWGSVLVQEDPTCCGAAKPLVCHNYWAPCPGLCSRLKSSPLPAHCTEKSHVRQQRLRTDQKLINFFFLKRRKHDGTALWIPCSHKLLDSGFIFLPFSASAHFDKPLS